MNNPKPFNPLDKINLANSINDALIRVKPRPLGGLEEFSGAGVYSLYYIGDFDAYKPLSEVNRQRLIAPIYVGKAEASGKRKGGFLDNAASGNALYKRLCDHAKSINWANNLAIEDFLCRFLVVDETWIALGESMLISKYSPVWNAKVDGFGNHDPGKGRKAGARPKWDMLHPGRPWAANLPANPAGANAILDEIGCYLKDEYPPSRLLQPESYEYAFVNLQ